MSTEMKEALCWSLHTHPTVSTASALQAVGGYVEAAVRAAAAAAGGRSVGAVPGVGEAGAPRDAAAAAGE